MDIVERLIVAKDSFARERPMLRDTINDAANDIERLQKERDELYGYVRGLIGLTQLVRGRNDVPDDIVQILRTNHRVVDAAAYLTQIVPPIEP